MGIGQTLRSIDFLSAIRSWPAAYSEYTARSLTIGDGIVRDQGLDWDELQEGLAQRVMGRDTAEAFNQAIADGRDEEAVALLDALWKQDPGENLKSAIVVLASKKLALRTLEKSLGSLIGEVDRIDRYASWLQGLSEINLATSLKGEAMIMTAPTRRRNWVAKAMQSREMEAWTRLYDATNGFTASPSVIADQMLVLAKEPGYSRQIVQILLPVMAQTVASFSALEDRRLAMLDLLLAMKVHAQTGTWPEGVDAAIRAVRGDEMVTLKFPTA